MPKGKEPPVTTGWPTDSSATAGTSNKAEVLLREKLTEIAQLNIDINVNIF